MTSVQIKKEGINEGEMEGQKKERINDVVKREGGRKEKGNEG